MTTPSTLLLLLFGCFSPAIGRETSKESGICRRKTRKRRSRKIWRRRSNIRNVRHCHCRQSFSVSRETRESGMKTQRRRGSETDRETDRETERGPRKRNPTLHVHHPGTDKTSPPHSSPNDARDSTRTANTNTHMAGSIHPTSKVNRVWLPPSTLYPSVSSLSLSWGSRALLPAVRLTCRIAAQLLFSLPAIGSLDRH